MRPSPSQVVSKLLQRWRTRGGKEVMSLGMDRLRHGLWSDDELLFLIHPATTGDVPRRDDFTFRRATSADGAAYARDIGTDSPATFAERLSGSTRCWIVTTGDHIVHASWTTTSAAWTRELGRYFRPPPGDTYIYESFTSPEVRGRGIYPHALAGILAAAGSERMNRAWVGVEAANEASIKAITKAGFTAALRVRYASRLYRVRLESVGGPLEADCSGCFPRHLGQAGGAH